MCVTAIMWVTVRSSANCSIKSFFFGEAVKNYLSIDEEGLLFFCQLRTLCPLLTFEWERTAWQRDRWWRALVERTEQQRVLVEWTVQETGEHIGQQLRGVKKNWINESGHTEGWFKRGREGDIIIIIQMIHFVTIEGRDFKNKVKARSISASNRKIVCKSGRQALAELEEKWISRMPLSLTLDHVTIHGLM